MKARTAILLAVALVAALNAPRAPRTASAAALPSDDRAIAHVLNRMTFGPRAGDVARVRSMGLQQYIEQQLYPERIADSAMDARLAPLTTIKLSSREIAEQYEQPELEMRRARQQQKAASGADPNAPPTPSTPLDPNMRRQLQNGQVPPGVDPEMLRRMQQQAGGAPQGNLVMVELSEQKLLRAVYSERQLQEVLTDFWFNHFNVDSRKGRDRYLLTSYERDAIRPNVLGKFRDLLGATAKSPAMLFYLDNFQSVDPQAQNGMNRGRGGLQPGMPGRGRFGINMQPPAQQRQARGLNENYGRELMELHTLGVDGGYTQKDVTEVARAFTGWSIDNPRGNGGFVFNAQQHDNREKVVLGHTIKAGGMRDGEEVLDILASHPSTARFVSMKLARRFVSDTPPPALVSRMAQRFTETKGDLREVMRTLLTSPEFLSEESHHAKVKTPLEFVVSSVRALNAEVTTARPLVNALQQLGMPLYQCQPPTGYKDTADAWTNTGALVARMNFAQTLASNQPFGPPGNGRGNRPNQPPQRAAQRGRAGGSGIQVSLPSDSTTLIETVLGKDVSDTTKTTIGKATNVPQMVALTLGSPEFQRR